MASVACFLAVRQHLLCSFSLYSLKLFRMPSSLLAQDLSVVGRTPHLQPVETAERVQLLDVLRGFAIFGIPRYNHNHGFCPSGKPPLLLTPYYPG